ncbi:MAG: hypothetical protein KatS3mg108_2816 [Isosphaeraceae bacterium]|jgi:thiamine-phosphate pyrophosphorylase|nr:MAG: hypothetical protein KatS3mg108_2816 [Isosphaeraceae bacterium]
MLEYLTAAAARMVEEAQRLGRLRGAEAAEPRDLLAALAGDEEGRAYRLMVEHGVDPAGVVSSLVGEGSEVGSEGEGAIAGISGALRAVVALAVEQARAVDRLHEAGTEHLLWALVETDEMAAGVLRERGLREEELRGRLERQVALETAPIPLAPEIKPLELTTPGEGVDLARILDASANRAREGLRVVEDYVRFVLDDPLLVRRLKDCRHRLGEATRALEGEGRLLPARDTAGDVGTHIMTGSERVRENPRGVLAANFKRTAEALRSLEEYTKLVDPWLAGRFEVLRYDLYILEKLVLTMVGSRRTLAEARLYFLVGGGGTLRELVWLVGEALEGGVQVVQLREKGLDDRTWLSRAREVRILTAKAGALFIVNDRPDLARLAGADGVHVGQGDVTVRDARRIVGPSALIGVSTHRAEELERAVLDGAGYVGVGPVFESVTKEFDRLAGVAYVRHAAEATRLPWFAIGGIGLENVDQVLEAGARRVAVGSAIARADRPRAAAAELRRRLDAVWESEGVALS